MHLIATRHGVFDFICVSAVLTKLGQMNLQEAAVSLLNERVDFVRLKSLLCEFTKPGNAGTEYNYLYSLCLLEVRKLWQ